MEKYLTIGEVSKLLDIPISTLRYWQTQGIFSTGREDNNYRCYTVANVVEIAEIAFYRNIGIPVKDMKNFNRLGIRTFEKSLANAHQELRKKIDEYQAMYELVELKGQHIRTILELKEVDYVYEQVPFDRIVRFYYNDSHQLIRYTKNPSLYVRVMPSSDIESDIRGIISENGTNNNDSLIWEKSGDAIYAAFLVEEIASEGYKNNIAEKLELIRQKHRTGIILANYLLSSTEDGRRIDYLKAYVELLD